MKCADLEARIQQAISLVKLHMPMMVPLIVQVRISLDMRIDTACVFPSGRMLVSPYFIAPMSPLQLAYLIAHEVMHLYLKSSEREKAFKDSHNVVNIAHDFIINHKLTQVFGIDPPCSGLNWTPFQKALRDSDYYYEDERFPSLFEPLDNIPLEELVIDLKAFIIYATAQRASKEPKNSQKEAQEAEEQLIDSSSPWDVLDQLNLPKLPENEAPSEENTQETPSTPEPKESCPQQESRSESADDNILDEIDLLDDESLELQQRMQNDDEIQKVLDLLLDDVCTQEDELTMFPEMEPGELKKLIDDIKKGIVQVAAIKKASGNGKILAGILIRDNELAENKGDSPGDTAWETGILHDAYYTPWELALQKWFDDAGPRTRSWAHASRRQGDRMDIALPGHQRDGWTLNLVLDTSGSMEDEIPRMLGSLEQFARAASVTTVRILQCDVNVTFDELVEIDDLAKFQAQGGGGSDMSPAMLRLADDPTVEHVIVMTDGWIDYPPTVPYDVLWALSEENDGFKPEYGRVIPIT